MKYNIFFGVNAWEEIIYSRACIEVDEEHKFKGEFKSLLHEVFYWDEIDQNLENFNDICIFREDGEVNFPYKELIKEVQKEEEEQIEKEQEERQKTLKEKDRETFEDLKEKHGW